MISYIQYYSYIVDHNMLCVVIDVWYQGRARQPPALHAPLVTADGQLPSHMYQGDFAKLE